MTFSTESGGRLKYAQIKQPLSHYYGFQRLHFRVAVISAKNHKRQRRKRRSVTAKREKSQTPKVLTAILTLPNLN